MKRILQFLFKKRFYTRREMMTVVKNVSSASVKGTLDYIQSPHVFIKQKSSGKHIKNSELSCDNDNKALSRFVYARLNDIGIEMKGETA